jgi:hypothetical protein
LAPLEIFRCKTLPKTAHLVSALRRRQETAAASLAQRGTRMQHPYLQVLQLVVLQPQERKLLLQQLRKNQRVVSCRSFFEIEACLLRVSMRHEVID